MKHRVCAFLLFIFVAGCGQEQPGEPASADSDVSALTHDYLFLELSMGWHDNGHVDAYFGPEDIRKAANEAQMPLDEINTAFDLMHAGKSIRSVVEL